MFAHHYNPFSPALFISDVFNETYIGVSLFFVLSGFLITIRYDDLASFKDYIQNRFARIYPLYFILTTLTFIVAGWDTWVYVANITFLKGFFDHLKFSGISQSWSLTVEEMFYLLAPLIFILLRKNKLWWILPPIFLSIGVVIYKPFGSLNFMLVYTFFGRSLDFFAGILVAKIFQKRAAPTTNNQQLFTWLGILMLMSCLILLASVRGDAKYAMLTTPGLLIHHVLVPASTAVLLYGLLTEHGFIRRWLSTGWMQLLGKSSYALYLIHIGVMAAWISVAVNSNPIVVFVLLNILAVILYWMVERPLHAFFMAHGKHGK